MYRLIRIETPDGAGEATKSDTGEPWSVTYPTGGFRWYGTAAEVKAEARRRLIADYGEAATVTFQGGE